MIADTIRDRLHSEPFHPFRVRASSGQAYVVRNPGLVVLMKSEVFIAKPNSDSFAIIPYLLVAGVEGLNGENGNGKARSRAKPRGRRDA